MKAKIPVMKKILVVILCIGSFVSYAQEIKPAEFDGHKWEAPYLFQAPKDWGIERFLMPIGFAPQISYKGVEDIRFMPGWAKATGDEYWTYAFLWYLDSLPKVDATIIETNLKNYYTGLIKVNAGDKIPAEKMIPVVTSFQETQTSKEDLLTFTGSVEMLDYMQQKAIKLYCIVHLKNCKELGKAIMFYELSPKPFTHNNWQNLDQLWVDFKCKK